MLVYEYASQVQFRNGTFVPLTKIYNKTGFRSVYAYLAQDVQGKTDSKGLSQYKPYSNTLPIDCDNEDVFICVLNAVREKKLMYRAWRSGGRGGHVELFHDWLGHYNLPKWHKKIATSIHLDVDVSLYRASSLYRLPNTVHKNGNIKVIFEEALTGDKLVLPTEIELEELGAYPKIELEIPNNSEYRSNAGFVFLRYSSLFGSHVPCGRRFWTLWSLGVNFIFAGYSWDTVQELLDKLNGSWSEPKDTEGMQVVYKEILKFTTKTNNGEQHNGV